MKAAWLVLGCTLSVVTSLPTRAQSHLAPSTDAERTAALNAYDAGRTEEAKARLGALSSRYPHDFAVQEALGLADAESGDTQGALPHLLAAVNARPHDPGANANLGAAYLALKQVPEAIKVLTAAAAGNQANAEVLTNLGRALFLNQQPVMAADALGRASQLRPGDVDVRYDWALALDTSHQSAAALGVLAQVPQAQRTPAIESLWGDVAEHAGRFEDAVQHMQRAAQEDGSEPNVYALTVELLRHWAWQAAKQMAEYGSAKYPGSERLRFARGVSLFGNAQFPQAADAFADMVRQSPENATYSDLLGRSCAALGGTESANCSALPALAEQHPDNARLAAFAAISILHRPESSSDLARAEVLLRRSLNRDPNFAETWYQLGVLQQQQQNWAGSALSLQKAIALRPEYAEAHYKLSRAYAHTGHREQANTELALHECYAQQEKLALDAQLKEVTLFLTDVH